MKNRFSPRELFELRNNIPVDMLIRDHLQIPSKTSLSRIVHGWFFAALNVLFNMGESQGFCRFWSIEFLMKLKNVLRSEYLSFLVEDL